MKTKVHKVVLFVVDHDDLGAAGVQCTLEDANYPNDCMHPTIVTVETKEVEWSDEHPLNNYKTQVAAFQNLFSTEKP